LAGKSKKQKSSKMVLELIGAANLVEMQGSKRVSTIPLNMEMVLQILKDGLEAGADAFHTVKIKRKKYGSA
jgi:hypothetical protein